MADAPQDLSTIRRGLAVIRRRRLFLWATILLYVPALLLVLELELSAGTTAKLFALWVALLCVAVGLTCVVKCPRCEQPYHTNGPTFLPLRRCLHCGLPLRFEQNNSRGAPYGRVH